MPLLCLVRPDDFEPRVKTPLGGIKGYYKISEYGRQYKVFEGIPYAQPPIGKLRFKAPQPVVAWPGELQATKLAHECLLYNHKPDHLPGDRVRGSEDCLYLNVYVPDIDDYSIPLPVIFWIYGGAFTHGSANMYGARYLMDKNVILVIANYRVGPLGFLSTDDKVVPGNMGLKDQSMALRWVHDNIEYFGGDPNKVTLSGLSAGGASVHYHYLSPLSAGLFQNGISASGTALQCWAQTEKPLEKAMKLGILMGCPTESTKEMIKCLRQRPAKAIVEAVKDFMPWLYNPFTPFGPVVEKAGDKPFINRSPIDILKTGDVADKPWITSVVSEEGLYPVAEFAARDDLLKELNEKWDIIAPYLLDYNYTIPTKLHAKTALKIKNHYMENNPINRQNVKSIIKMVGDRMFLVDAEKAARMQAKVNKSPVWFYYYSYRATTSLSDTFSGTKENFGVSHADDTFLVIENPFVNPTTTESDRTMYQELMHLWASFAEKGIQDFYEDWKQVDQSKVEFQYLHISGPEKYKMASDANFGDKKFWASLNFAENVLESSLDLELNSLKDEL
ncbi:venom carboxylesterase-6-like isoform X3 [Phymastichus coffea]|uniref:venom carboxylesterase-6-like isoform X2 n=1 Tax=Phymastichus coffea TaxID=108790 RepID=UPI00273C51CB|nr:venom carboxylesterase-6-like isoform X2 [Phymastichus coffea]XP_058800336.1 venom carboxylesterase-6-like isoform X3 [Phymastichus coffea]